MNISISGFGAVSTNMQTLKLVGTNDRTANNSQAQKKTDKKNNQNNIAAVLTISSSASKDRSAAITKRYQAMKEATQKQIESLNGRLRKASELGNTELEKQLTENIKQLQNDFSALDEQLNAELFEEQKRKADEAKAREEKAAKQREKEQEKYKPEEENIKNAERNTFEFFAKSDISKENIQNSKIQKATLERAKSRIEGEMAMDSAAKAASEQRHKAKMSEIANSEYSGGKLVKKGHSDVPYVSDKTILTEKKRIANGLFSVDESSSVEKLNKLSKGIKNFENDIVGEIADMNGAIVERTEDAKDVSKSQKEPEKESQDETQIKSEENEVVDNNSEVK